MNASEIRADLVAALRASARTIECAAVFQRDLAGTARVLAAQHRHQADQIESSLKANLATGLADESKAALVDFKLNGVASSAAPNFKKAA